MSVFKLPDLGEGLREAEISAWHVDEGDQVVTDQPLVAVETDKAVVDVPSPRSGRIAKRYAKVGDIVPIGSPLVAFDDDDGDAAETDLRVPTPATNPQTDDTGRIAARAAIQPAAIAEDRGTVVGEVTRGKEVVEERPTAVAATELRVKATPAVRALARRLRVDLGVVTPSGPDGTILKQDVERVASIFEQVGPLEPLRGVRRAMAVNMTQARDEVMHAAVFEDADVHDWRAGTDPTLRLIRAMVAGVAAEPELNAWYDAQAVGRRLLKNVDLGVAVDTPDGLFVPLLRNVGERRPDELRAGLDRLIADVKARKVPAEELRGHTITLSNFGTLAGRYAVPVVMPPTVAIVGAGKIREAVVPRGGVPVVRRILPLSLSFDHRAVTGAAAARFLTAMIEDLAKPV